MIFSTIRHSEDDLIKFKTKLSHQKTTLFTAYVVARYSDGIISTGDYVWKRKYNTFPNPFKKTKLYYPELKNGVRRGCTVFLDKYAAAHALSLDGDFVLKLRGDLDDLIAVEGDRGKLMRVCFDNQEYERIMKKFSALPS
jgi:hypothetical protein